MMGASRPLLLVNRRNVGILGRGLLGFLGTFLLWSLFVGDWRSEPDVSSVPVTEQRTPSTGSTNLKPVWKGWHAIEDVIVFGDSYSSTRFDFQGRRPSWDHPFGNQDQEPRLPYGEGPKWIEYLHDTYNASRFRVTNMASPGATVERHYWEPRPQGQPPVAEKNTLKEEITLFKGSATTARMAPFDDWTRETALFAAWFGVNEILHSTQRGLRLPMDAIFATYHASLERLYALGARNFLLLNLPPVDTILLKPFAGESDPGQDIAAFNAALAGMAARLRRRHPDATVFELDVHAQWTRAIRDPAAFPLTERIRDAITYCGAYAAGGASLTAHAPECEYARDEYFWADDHRPSHVVQRFTAATIVEDCFGPGGPKGSCSSGTRP